MEKRARDLQIGDVITSREGSNYVGKSFAVVYVWNKGAHLSILTDSGNGTAKSMGKANGVDLIGNGIIEGVKPTDMFTVQG